VVPVLGGEIYVIFLEQVAVLNVDTNLETIRHDMEELNVL
jgi:hypothetical protein